MPKCVHLFITVCIILCFSFNSTLPLLRDTSFDDCANRTQRYTKVSNFENMPRKIKDTTHDFGNDIRQYEHLVIMKKYPYLDLHELEMKYFPIAFKNTRYRHSDNMYLDRKTQRETSLNDPEEDLINVEITNRGLTGFAIPPLLSKHGIKDCKSKGIIKPAEEPTNFALDSKKTTNSNVLQSLTEDINAYIDKKSIPII